MIIQERYTPVLAAANATVPLSGSGIGGFLCVTSGTLTVYDYKNAVVLNAFPVLAGTAYGIPLFTGNGSQTSARVVLAGGASGTVLVQ